MSFFKRKSKEEPVKELKAFISGNVIPIEEVDDPVFSSKALGEGIAIRPNGEVITSPCAGEISMIADTLHAIGLTLDNGAELLLHIGINTVAMNGEGFKVLVKAGDKVQAGTPLLEFDIALIQKNGYATDCILLLANSDRFPGARFLAGMDANQNETVICHF